MMMMMMMMMMSVHSADVRQHLRQRLGDHSATVLGHGALPHSDAEGQGVHSLPSDPEPAPTATGRILPTCVVLYQRH